MSEPRIDPLRPEACPKRHALWYFDHWDQQAYDYHFAVCDGCKHVWRWDGTTDRPLQPAYAFNPERLVELVQAYGAALGYFTRKHSRAVTAHEQQPWRF